MSKNGRVRDANGTTLRKILQLVWNGESECEPFDLNAHKDEIYSVIQYGRNANQDAGASSFT